MPRQVDWDNRIYALYKGDELLADGTVYEISKNVNKSLRYIKWMTFPHYEKRLKKSKDRLQMVLLDDEE